MQERLHAESAKMVPDTTNRLNKAAEELRELIVRTLVRSRHGRALTDPEFPSTRTNAGRARVDAEGHEGV